LGGRNCAEPQRANPHEKEISNTKLVVEPWRLLLKEVTSRVERQNMRLGHKANPHGRDTSTVEPQVCN